jgi:anhydro-N-acetylmuramic acid kinase
MKIYRTIGLMSGTSLDGLDIAYCEFEKKDAHWTYTLRIAETFPYDKVWVERLSNIVNASALALMETHVELGRLFGHLTRSFIEKNKIEPVVIASHGHTVFHQPDKGFTTQIGSGYEIVKACNTKVVCDFRSFDVALGGQGAPLVPIGDKLLFGKYDFCLNLGGISNISFDVADKRTAYDIAPQNIVLNDLAKQIGKNYDDKGSIARTGKTNDKLLNDLNQLDYYQRPYPKSLGIEYIEKHVFPIINASKVPLEDKLHTFNHHAAMQIDREIKKVVPHEKKGKLLVTGGGAFNSFFIDLLSQYANDKYVVEVPDSNTVNFKEALIFAFLGVLRIRKEINVLKSVTGAIQDSCSGVVLDL